MAKRAPIRTAFLSSAVSALALSLAGCVTPSDETALIEPREPWAHTGQMMVTTSDARASEAGLEILKEGGSAVDATIASMMVLGLVEPQSAGIGGGGFLLRYDRETGDVVFQEGREKAPASTTTELFYRDGEVLGFFEAWLSGRSVGTPALVPMLWEAHQTEGVLPWARLFDAAIKHAEEGFTVSPRTVDFIQRFEARMGDRSRLKTDPGAKALFYGDDETPVQEGETLFNAAYADTMRKIAAEGPDALMTGEIAEAIIDAVQNDSALPGALTLEDLANYDPKVREPVCGTYREHTVCTSPPPGSGVLVVQALGIMERASPEPLSNDADGWGAFINAGLLAYSDRNHYVADADQVPVPIDGLLNPDYLAARADLIGDGQVEAAPGDPSLFAGGDSLLQQWGMDPALGTTGTTHLSVVAPNGDAVALTATVESIFGNQTMVHGFFLNNQLTDFAREAEKDGKPLANAPAPFKRPRSSMSPTLVFDPDGDLMLVTGSPGGNNIPGYVLKTIVATIDMGMSAQEASDAANVVARPDRLRIEKERAPEGVIETLQERGFAVEGSEGETSGLNLILVTEDGLDGGADIRRIVGGVAAAGLDD